MAARTEKTAKTGVAHTAGALTPASREPGRPGLLLASAIVLVCAAVLWVHWPALSAQALCADDGQYVLINPLVQNPSWASVRQFLGEVLKPSTVWGYYQPLAMTSLMLDWALGGRGDDFRVFHRTSLVLHALNTGLVIVLLYLLFDNVWAAAIAGVLFGLHPLTVEPIVWTGERKTVLATFFVLWSLITYVLSVQRARGSLRVVSAFCFALALLSKPTATPLPVLLLVLDFWPLRRLSWRALREKIPFFGIAMVSATITFISQARSGTVEVPGHAGLLDAPLIVCHNIVFYLTKIVWPHPLTAYYPVPEPLSLAQPAVLGGVIGTVLLTIALVVSLRWTRAAVAGAVFALAAVFPTMGIIGFANTLTADKYAYLPAVGLLMVVAAGVRSLWKLRLSKRRGTILRASIVLATLVLAGLAAGATRRQIGLWRDTETLYKHMLTIAPNVFELNKMVGSRLLLEGRGAEAEPYLRRALAANPADGETHNNLGRLLFEQGRMDEALREFAEAVRRSPDFYLARLNLGRALFNVGRLGDAQPEYEAALRLKPDAPEVRNSLGILFVKLGRFDDAEAQFRECIRLNPSFANGQLSLAQLLVQRGRTADAIRVLEQAETPCANDPRIGAELARLRNLPRAPG